MMRLLNKNIPSCLLLLPGLNPGKGSAVGSELLSSGAIHLFRTLSYWKSHLDIDLDDATAS